MNTLNKERAANLSSAITVFNTGTNSDSSQIVHIGIGGFHRSHQAFALAKLIHSNPQLYGKWQITGVGLMPNDLALVQDFNQQDQLYALRTIAYDQQENVYIIPSIREMLHASIDSDRIISKISDPNTKVVSFTITEGGYLFDFEKHRFMIEHADIQHDLQHKDQPKTVFGFLGAGLALRMKSGIFPLTLLSCDNILGNGDILRLSLLAFLEHYDSQLKGWVESHVAFPNSMVDRITPVATEVDKANFEQQYGVRDNCLVVSEDFFQWVIEQPLNSDDFPPLDQVGVQFVDHVASYEGMKLGVLNAGHTLVGLLGDALGYDKIHSSVLDSRISKLFESFVVREVIPMLAPIEGVDFSAYFEKVRTRFANAMINDSTARIISGSSDKFPKFVLPTIQKQLQRETKNIEISALIVALWWRYLDQEMKRDEMKNVQDNLKDRWKQIFQEKNSSQQFLAYNAVFSDLADNETFQSSYKKAIYAIESGTLLEYIDSLIF